jgi:hypothetical protein
MAAVPQGGIRALVNHIASPGPKCGWQVNEIFRPKPVKIPLTIPLCIRHFV